MNFNYCCTISSVFIIYYLSKFYLDIINQFTINLFIILLKLELAASHLDHQCNFGQCLNSLLLPIRHAYCDSDYRCKCEPGYVAVKQHLCAEIKNYGKTCDYDSVCKSNENLFCDHNLRLCDCKRNFVFDEVQNKCIPSKCFDIRIYFYSIKFN